MGARKSSVAEIGHAQQQRLGRLLLKLTETVVTDASHFERQASDIAKYMEEGKVLRRKRGPDEYDQQKRVANEAGNLQRRVESSAVKNMPMINIYKPDDVAEHESIQEKLQHTHEFRVSQMMQQDPCENEQESIQDKLQHTREFRVSKMTQQDPSEPPTPAGKIYSNASACNSDA